MNATTLLPVNPVSPVAAYIGGKRNLPRRLCALIEATPHDAYAEAFVGMGGVFFRRRTRPKCEIINDLSGEVANLFRCMRAHPGALCDLISLQLHCRADFDHQQQVDPTQLTDLQRAARFVFLQKVAFGGKVTGQDFGMCRDRASRFQASKVGADLMAAGRRLETVVIEQLTWSDFVRRYDRPGMLFYLDPPYFDCEGDYGPGMFDQGQFELLAEQMAGIRGRFILSLNDRPEVRRIFGRFNIEGVGTHYSLQGKGAKPAGEVIITGGGSRP